MLKVLGISASLRNARLGRGSVKLLSDIRGLESKNGLIEYISSQGKIHLKNFFDAGRGESLPFDAIYAKLKKLKGDCGLSNSEAAVVAGLWGVYRAGVEIDYLSLASHFSPSGNVKALQELKEQVLAADALLISTPVYFGDRSSLSQSFIELLHSDDDLRAHIQGKIYAGLSVGAKRNGGQETTLIYQIIDMLNLNMLAVGNDAATTSQYGGTGVGGDIGTFCEDTYGIDTCVGTGRRLAEAVKLIQKSNKNRSNKLTVDLWLLQDTPDRKGYYEYKEWVAKLSACYKDTVSFRLLDFTDSSITRCIACDICPISNGPPEEYRCIISKERDLFRKDHEDLLLANGILLCAYSPKNRQKIKSVYQKFIERTRYFRRDDYVFHNVVAAPFVISEISSNQNLHIRMLTSLVRHNTVLHQPIIGFEHGGAILNLDDLLEKSHSFINAVETVSSNIALYGRTASTKYNPIGYVISKEKCEQI